MKTVWLVFVRTGNNFSSKYDINNVTVSYDTNYTSICISFYRSGWVISAAFSSFGRLLLRTFGRAGACGRGTADGGAQLPLQSDHRRSRLGRGHFCGNVFVLGSLLNNKVMLFSNSLIHGNRCLFHFWEHLEVTWSKDVFWSA